MRTIVFVAALAVAAGLAAPTAETAAPSPSPLPPGFERFVVDPSASTVSYRVDETFLGDNRFNTAVGTTNEVHGDIVVNRQNPRASRVGRITVDISALRSDSTRRDNAIRNRWLESARYPLAEFLTTEIRGLPQTYREGEALKVAVVGNLKIRDVIRQTTFDATLTLSGATLTAVATTEIRMTDFGFEPPSILGFVRAQNEAKLELRLTARRAPR
ncbi:MAG: YceI family protein [Armatimonadota bacterium]|nr:YceI family protein [Armatimonadota bacterium]MDR5696795.1 YceI family protein [Armatimonadota bacterium]